MIEAAFQKSGKTLYAYTLEDEDKLSEYHDNQILKCKITGVKKPRSYEQLKLFWVLCRTVADNTEDEHWDTMTKVSEQIKHALKFYDHDNIIVTPDGKVKIPVRSIAFKNLSHMEACNFFDRAFEIMAKKIGVTVEELTANAN